MADLLAWEQAFLDVAAVAELTACKVVRLAHEP